MTLAVAVGHSLRRVKLVTLNIYAGVFLDQSLAGLREIAPDVLCLQELHQDDIPELCTRLGLLHHTFVPGVEIVDTNRYGFRPGQVGIGILSRFPFDSRQVDFYSKPEPGVPVFDVAQGNHCDRALLSVVVRLPRGYVRVGTTHFTWTVDGRPDAAQRVSLGRLLGYVSRRDLDILCGDFNAPRSGEVMAHLSCHFDDHAPADLLSTLDPALHRQPGLQMVVDHVLSRRGLADVTVSVVEGLSDHKAIVADFSFPTVPASALVPVA